MNRFLRRLLLLAAIVVIGAPAGAANFGIAGYEPKEWRVGAVVGTYSGPSHAQVLTHVNNLMAVMGSEPGFQFEDFDVGTPFGAVITWEPQPPLAFALNYYYSQYTAEADFTPHGWGSHRKLTTNLHELLLSMRHSLSFIRSKTIVPYIGGGLLYSYGDSKLEIELENTTGVVYDSNDPESEVIPDQSFEVGSRKGSIGGVALAGVMYNITGRVQLVAEMQGILGQVRQEFDYSGSLQHIAPGLNPDVYLDQGLNDMLFGSYQLDLNGLRLTIGLVFGI